MILLKIPVNPAASFKVAIGGGGEGTRIVSAVPSPPSHCSWRPGNEGEKSINHPPREGQKKEPGSRESKEQKPAGEGIGAELGDTRLSARWRWLSAEGSVRAKGRVSRACSKGKGQKGLKILYGTRP